jgi:apolipoprotein N-acyltransferase
MQKISWTRVILGGLLAGLVINICEFLVDGLVLGDQWTASLKSMHRPPLGASANAAFMVWGFLVGVYALWLYASLRPRLGPGPKTAAFAGVAVWILSALLASISAVAMRLFPRRLVAYDLVLTLVEMVAGTVIGAWLYKEPAGT